MSIAQLGLTGTPSKQYSVTPKRAATTVTKSIGTSSRDYSTMTAWEADLDNTLVYVSGDDAVGECYNDSTFDESVTINNTPDSVGLGDVTLTVADGERHDGTEGTGARIVRTSGGSASIAQSLKPQLGTMTIEWLEIDHNGNNDGGFGAVYLAGSGGTTSTYRVAKNLIVHGVNGYGRCKGIYSTISGGTGYIFNCFVYDISATFDDTISSGAGIYSINYTETYNCSVLNTDRGVVLSGANVITNNVISCDASDDDDFVLSGTYSHLLSSDTSATGTGSLISKASSDQFVSTVSGSEDLHLKSGSDAIGAGTDLGATPDGVQYDIDGFDRDAANRVWDIGADQAAGAVTKTIGTTARDYSTITLWEADLDLSTVYQSGDDAVGECYNDSDFTESVTIDGGATVGLDSVSLGVASGENHDGTAGTGVRIVGNYALTVGIALSDIVFTVSDIENSLTTVNVEPMKGQSRSDVRWLRCIVHHSHAAYAGQINSIRINRRGAVMNNIVYGTLVDRDVSLSIGILANSESDLGYYGYVYNNTVYNVTNTDTSITTGGARGVSLNNVDLATHTIAKNNICVDTDTPNDPGFSSDIYFTDTANPAPYNLTSDDTGDDSTSDNTGALINKVSSDQFVSIVSGSEDLHLKAGSDAIGAGVDLGTTPDGVQYDIDGFDRDAANRVWDIGADQAAATITKTIGTTARDYSTMTLWEADLDDATVYQSGDDAVGECYNDSAFDETISVAGTLIPDTATLTAANGEKHDGTAGTGVRNVQSVYGGHRFILSSTGLTTFTLSDIEFDKNGITTNGSLPVYSAAGSTNARYHRLLIHNGTAGSSSTAMLLQGTTGYDLEVLNNIVYDIGGTETGVYHVYGINCPDNTKNPGVKQLNNTVFNITSASTWLYGQCIGIVHSYGNPVFNSLCKNNICMDTSAPSVGGYVGDFGGSTGTHISHNLSSDSTASGTGSLTGKTAANQFVSIVSGSEDLHLKAGADAIGAGVDLGTTPTGVEVDIDGRDRDAEGDTWSIGADQFVQIISSSSGKNFFIFFY